MGFQEATDHNSSLEELLCLFSSISKLLTWAVLYFHPLTKTWNMKVKSPTKKSTKKSKDAFMSEQDRLPY